jgi:preprotein translocase subunit SecD
VSFTDEGAKKMAKLTRENPGKLLAILVDGKVVSAPRIVAETSQRARITGRFTMEEATRIQQALRGKRPQEEPRKR